MVIISRIGKRELFPRRDGRSFQPVNPDEIRVCGVGRDCHFPVFDHFFHSHFSPDFLEIIPCNFMGFHGEFPVIFSQGFYGRFSIKKKTPPKRG